MHINLIMSSQHGTPAVCPRSLDPICTVTYNIKCGKTIVQMYDSKLKKNVIKINGLKKWKKNIKRFKFDILANYGKNRSRVRSQILPCSPH